MTVFLIQLSDNGDPYVHVCESKKVADKLHDLLIAHAFDSRWDRLGGKSKPRTLKTKETWLQNHDFWVYRPEAVELVEESDLDNFAP
jgi:hypothetical protein